MSAQPLPSIAPLVRVTAIDSANLKMARVGLHLNEIRRFISECTKKADTYEIIKDADGRETVNFRVGPPREVLVIIGEIVYQFKSALDHLTFQLVLSNFTKQP